MKIIGLTGNAGCGKTSVARYLKTLGAAVIEADEVVKELTSPGQPLLQTIREVFGEEYFLADGSLDRIKMRRLIFADAGARQRLEEIVHPAVIEAVQKKIRSLQELPDPPRVLVLEAPLLLETGMDSLVDEVWVVIATPEAAVRRLMARDRIPPEQAYAMLAAQWPQEEKVRRAHRVIDNSGDFNHTREQAAYFYHKLLAEDEEE
ncbi:dephospho-CoA kinase [Desulfothermobacter acidiphilus]|uniref:dephospho-CoA kinase n=1 Tax=Desulfothermobacter acidiphilus TaxID=1938353 RepID=UPI003F88F48D